MIYLIVSALLFSGCWMSRPDTLSPEQIQAYKDMNMDVYLCFAVAGPPPGGKLMKIVVPKDTEFTPTWGDNCSMK